MSCHKLGYCFLPINVLEKVILFCTSKTFTVKSNEKLHLSQGLIWITKGLHGSQRLTKWIADVSIYCPGCTF
jgi:hypothetical protein